ncbi:MAG: response regulator transcription factor [Planctomycetota bacterium]|jgi:two-component system alkaline phosphatase synthesis response regulator PhoP
MSGASILVLEDESDLAFLLQQNLEQQGHEVTHCASIADAKTALDDTFDLLLLDVNLPDGSGFDLLGRLRKEQVWTPAVFLTARDDEADRLLGFAIGGDDYVIKPFSMAELLARVGAIVRRSRQTSTARFEHEAFQADFQRYKLVKNGEETALTYLESELLRYLTARPAEAVSRSELLNKVWGYDRFPSTRTVDTHMLNLRRKLEDDPAQPRYLLTVHGIGYKFVP